jgi:hypothetical protein
MKDESRSDKIAAILPAANLLIYQLPTMYSLNEMADDPETFRMAVLNAQAFRPLYAKIKFSKSRIRFKPL